MIISTIFAIDKSTALWGFVDMYQGMFVLLSYVLLTFLTINFVNNKRDINLFVNAFLFLMIVEGIIGVGQYFGFDFFQTSVGKSLILPSNLIVEDLSFSFGPKTIYGTLFNTNFVGSFATLMLPLSVAFLLGANSKKQRIVSGIAVLLMLFVWIGCNSRAGYFGVAVSSIFALWLFRKVIRKHWKVSVGIVTVIMIMLVGLNIVSDGLLSNRLRTFNVIEQVKKTKEINNKGLRIEKILLGNNTFTIDTNEIDLKFIIDNDKLFFLDENDNELSIKKDGKIISIEDKRYDKFRISMAENYPGVTVMVATYWRTLTINFYISDVVRVLGSGGRLTEPFVAEGMKIFDGLESIASNRGYIWSRTIPLLKSYIVKGAGADNFPLSFPQDDFVAKLNIGMDANTVIDKPHNLYLQIATNTGVLAILSLLVIWVIYIISSFKLYNNTVFDSIEKYIGCFSLIGVIGYLTAGIFNDSVSSVAPLFWIILGLGISINIRLKSKMFNN